MYSTCTTKKPKLLYLLALLFASTLFSNTIDSLELQDKQKDIFENLNKDPTKNIEKLDLPKTTILDESREGECFNISSITIKDITLLNNSDITQVTQKYINRCNYLSDLKNLTNELNALYIDKGYITSQVYIIAQDISSGELSLASIEGKVGDISPKAAYTDFAFFNQKDKNLNIRDIESAIENINRLSSNHATMKLNPSNTTGYTDILVENEPTKRFGGSLGIDNYGSKKTGRAGGSARVNLDNIFGINDILNIYYNTSNNHFKDEKTKGNGYDYSFALGRTLLTFSQKNNRFEQYVKAGRSKFLSQGRTKTLTLDARYKLYHNQKHRVNVGASLSNYKTTNYFATIHMDTSSYRLTRLALSADYLYQIPGFYTQISGSYTRGLDLFNNYHSTTLDESYEYYNLSLSLMKDFNPLRYTLNIYSQFSKDELFGADKMSIGGIYSIRGFNKEGLSGNSGFYARNELLFNSSFNLFGKVDNSFFVGLDGGVIRADDVSEGGKLIGSAFGVKFNTKYLEATLQYTTPLYKKDVSISKNFLGFSIRAKF